MSDPSSSFIQKQFEFTAHIRNPDHAPLPAGIEERRMKIYRELFFNNVEGFISNGFPVLRQLYSDDNWHRMIRDFFITHRCHSPYFLQIAEEFLDYLQNERVSQPEDPAFIIELTHYEWVELALSVSEDAINMQGIDANGDLLSGRPVMSPLAWSLAYQYPVHQIGPDFMPEQPPASPTYLVAYRNRQDDVEFMDINPVTARLLQLISEDNKISGQQALEQIAAELQTANRQLIVEHGLQTLQELQQHGILLGSN